MSTSGDSELERLTDGTELIGESFDLANEANIPVNIWLGAEEDGETGESTGKYTLIADDYMPRRGSVAIELFKVRADSPEPLRAIVKERIIPLYEVALKALQEIAEGKHDNLYYWHPPRSDSTDSSSP